MNDLYQQYGRPDFDSLKEDPAKFLFDRGKLTQEQYNLLHGKSPSQIGQYLIKNGIISNTLFSQLSKQVGLFMR